MRSSTAGEYVLSTTDATERGTVVDVFEKGDACKTTGAMGETDDVGAVDQPT